MMFEAVKVAVGLERLSGFVHYLRLRLRLCTTSVSFDAGIRVVEYGRRANLGGIEPEVNLQRQQIPWCGMGAQYNSW